MRTHGTDRVGLGFSEATKLAVWNSARMVQGYDANFVRKDACGALIEWKNHGKTDEGGTGWEIDHITPVARGGGDNLGNLQALQWQNNRYKSDSTTNAYCVIR